MTGPRIVAAALALLAVAVLVATATYPPGSQGVPGPALMPRLLGVALLVVSLVLLRSPGTAAPSFVRHHGAVLVAMALLAGYALLWRAVPYGLLTGVVLLAFLRLSGLRWRAAVVAAAILATTLTLLFERGLGVRFS